MNKNPWLIAGIAASGVVMAASFVAAFPETVKRKTTSGSSSRSNYRSSTNEHLASRGWNGITDTFGYFAANTVAVASSVADSVCDTARETYSSVSDNVSSHSPSNHSTHSSSDSYSGGSDSSSF